MLLALILLGVGRARSQEVRGLVTLETEAGYLTNGYLSPSFASWAPETEAAFGLLGASGVLEWNADGGSVMLSGAARWMNFTDSTPTWSSYLLQAGVEGRPASRLAVRADASYSDVARPLARRTLWGQASLKWTASPRLRFSLGPGLAHRRFEVTEETTGPPPGPPGQGGGGSASEAQPSTTTSLVLFAGVEAWPSSRWQLHAEAFGSDTDASDTGIEYGGVGGSLRVTTWLRNSAFVALGLGLEGYGYRAAATGEPTVEIPDDDLIWRGDLTVGWPVARNVELRARLAGLTRSGSAVVDGPDYYASVGLRFAVGGTIAPLGKRRELWTATADGLRVQVRYKGPGRVYLVGDFNNWADPGLPLRSEAGDLHAATLWLEPGRYQYRIRVVEGDSVRWLDFPEGASTVDDGFGAQNGLLVVGPPEDIER